MGKYIIITTATNRFKDVQKIQSELLDKKLAACVQVTNITSYYNWKNERCKSKEYLLTIKTRASLFMAVKEVIKSNHSYELPEIISYDITNISEEFAKWIDENTRKDDLEWI